MAQSSGVQWDFFGASSNEVYPQESEVEMGSSCLPCSLALKESAWGGKAHRVLPSSVPQPELLCPTGILLLLYHCLQLTFRAFGQNAFMYLLLLF